MRHVVVLLVSAVLAAGCQPHVDAPQVLAPPEDLSTWTVPEVVQPPLPAQAPAPVPEKPTAAEKVYPFAPGTTYTVTVPVRWPLDIVLEPGEQVHNIVGGDREPSAPVAASRSADSPGEPVRVGVNGPSPEAEVSRRWDVKEGKDGTGDTLRSHIFVAASAPGMITGLIVTTTRRTYYLTCQSVKASPIRVLRWHYPTPTPEAPKTAEPPGLLPDPARPARYHVGYLLESHGRVPDWLPRAVVDDGKKLYIVYPEVTLFGSVPVVRMVGPNGPQLVNARQYLNVVIVDHLPAQAELRVGLGEHTETVTLTRGALRTIACPGDEACPVWPQASQTLARRQP